MLLDDYLAARGASASPVDRFDGFAVEVGIPPDWEPVHSAPGLRVWVATGADDGAEFRSNAVLTIHRIDAALAPGEVFAALSDQQLQSVPESRELVREFVSATNEPGFIGLLVLQIPDAVGSIDSVSRSRVITTDRQTLIAQLTLTALSASPLAGAAAWLAVRPAGPSAGGLPAPGRGRP